MDIHTGKKEPPICLPVNLVTDDGKKFKSFECHDSNDFSLMHVEGDSKPDTSEDDFVHAIREGGIEKVKGMLEENPGLIHKTY